MPSRASDFRLYLITDRHQTRGRPLIDIVAAALRGGVRAVQLRERDLAARELLALAAELRELTARHHAALLINDRVDVAVACGADGVHLPADSFAVGDARALLGPGRLIGVSTHRPDEVAAAAEHGADFAVLGPVFDTPSKRRYGPALGVGTLARATQDARLPVLAIGGIETQRVPSLATSGIAGVAVIRAVMAAADPARAAAEILQALAVR